ncbi:hypothetical protein B0H11DRAFT_1913103 [Mycena galericulata]|nr:hypothetical protein B0H11DRAFT_1913103 [Mycena galericulata]
MAPNNNSRVWADTDRHTQDRNNPGHFWDRKIYGGHWWGPDHRSTYVHELGVPLGTRDPPFVANIDRVNRMGPPPGEYRRSADPPRHSDGSRNRSPPHASSSSSGSGYYRRGHHHRRNATPIPDEAHHDQRDQYRRTRSPYPAPQHHWVDRPSRGKHRTSPMAASGARDSWRNDKGARALRQRAVESKRGRSYTRQWVRSIYPPDIAAAPVDAEGHPQCPLEVVEDDESDYGSDAEMPTLPANWRSEEKLRQLDSIELVRLGRHFASFKTPSEAEVGRWSGLMITTPDQAANLVRWVVRTEPSTYYFMRQQCLRLGSNVTKLRNEGELYLLRAQNPAAEQFWMRSTGKKKGPYNQLAPSGVRATDEERFAFLGSAVQGDDDTVVIITEKAASGDARSGTHTLLEAAAKLYDAMDTKLWPLGFRIDEMTWPTMRICRVYFNDVLAWYTINALAPRRNRVGTSIDRAKFMELLVRLLSIGGAFNRIAQLGEYEFANLPLEHYPFLTQNIGFSHIVAWFTQHGIRHEGEDIRILESFCRSRRNFTHKTSSPTNTEFAAGSTPQNMSDVLRRGDADIIHWRDLRHAQLQPNTESSYPQHPAAMPVDEDADMPSTGDGTNKGNILDIAINATQNGRASKAMYRELCALQDAINGEPGLNSALDVAQSKKGTILRLWIARTLTCNLRLRYITPPGCGDRWKKILGCATSARFRPFHTPAIIEIK